MTTSSPRSPRLLLIATLVLAVAGVVLLALPHPPNASDSPTLPPGAASEASASASPASGHRAASRAPASDTTAATPTTSAIAPALPPHGEGVAGDRAIQQALEAAWPADLAADEERQLCAVGRALLRADTTGVGRAKWPTVFVDRDKAVAPAFATARFRVQAVIARRDGVGRAVVHLVWAGTDRGGTYTDGRITELHFTRTTSKKEGGSTWTPQPRT
ncbi:hypothetical protein FBY35_0021 [Streptomyces sp. SLBN-118]|uniref:hypothetical protein n=1 Tax=Streptomyces sp. SLBN-118 TaxID=2768454 RepID=UPI001152AB35|nr:hypothetical protein [Streptomyces sp. SLBN-118]TQK49759.1 hypothetical protein FBY35_0021 [Streptomyces sp. SLBN-118]